MQTLGLASEQRRSDSRLKSIFWPSVANAWDVNYLGQQGFWICWIIACIQFVLGLLTGNPLAVAISTFSALVFLVGGMGVREANWPAAAMVFALYMGNVLVAVCRGQFPSVFAVLGAAVLFSNVRAAYLASEWKPAAEDGDRPTRFNETVADKLVDQLPAKLWPRLQVVYFSLASALLLLELLVLAVVLARHLGLLAGVIPH
jgi:hypothetical protein